jgi:membrane protein implicated in regulation of membrane protease activity
LEAVFYSAGNFVWSMEKMKTHNVFFLLSVVLLVISGVLYNLGVVWWAYQFAVFSVLSMYLAYVAARASR